MLIIVLIPKKSFLAGPSLNIENSNELRLWFGDDKSVFVNWADLALLRNLNVFFCPFQYVMTCTFGFSISNIPLNISGPSIPVNVDTSASLVTCANNIGIGNASFDSVIVPIFLYTH